MRRGHPGRGGWRGDSPRHFRPRTGGGPGFRPSRGFPLLPHDPSRFQPRFPYRSTLSPFNPLPGPMQQDDHARPYHDANKYKFINRLRNQRDQEKNLHLNDQQPFNDPEHFDKSSNRYHVNNMGDVDQRQIYQPGRHESLSHHNVQPWTNRTPRPFDLQDNVHENHSTKFQQEYTGHRPPASDHYEGKSGPVVDNSESFSRSIDDTVDIIRRKLQTRNDPQFKSTMINLNHDNNESNRDPSLDSYQQQHVPEEQTPRKKLPRQRPNVKTNCDKIKSNIVQQLFKMDKDRIHRLLDNPNSSHKFEYAINSLITESQNSFNRHLRTAAEKSLCGSRNEIMQYNETDTIYEDTFMKQMQCILEPQDSVLLEDIKPIVMAELNKVLQLSEFEYNLYSSHDDVDYRLQNYQDHEIGNYQNPPSFDPYTEECLTEHQDSSQYYTGAHSSSYNPPDPINLPHSRPSSRTAIVDIHAEYEDDRSRKYENSMYERRAARKSSDYEHRKSISAEKRRLSTASIDKPLFDSHHSSRNDVATPYFVANAEQLSEDEDDPFAELDKQYHVPVDHNFIEADDPTMPDYSKTATTASHDDKSYIKTPNSSNSYKTLIKNEFPHHNFATREKNTPSHNFATPETNDKSILIALEEDIKSEPIQSTDIQNTTSDAKTVDIVAGRKVHESRGRTDSHGFQNNKNNTKTVDIVSVKKEKMNESRQRADSHKSDVSNSSLDKSSTSSNSRKRSTDQRPSHRKEKRKKSESISDNNKQILNKNIIINLNDCAAKQSEACDPSGKSIFNLFFSKGETEEGHKDKNNEDLDGAYTEKYVKRKESQQKQPKANEDKKNNSTTSNHSTLGSKESANVSPTKDSKIKLKTFDMFESQSKKSSASHTLHRNSSKENSTKSPSASHEHLTKSLKTLPLKSISKHVSRRHVATQVLRKTHSKECQTVDNKSGVKMVVKAVQTDPTITDKPHSKSTNAFERMKEIDMEIQVLLQEKFKLYNSLESKDSCPNILPSLGMTVVNMEKSNEEVDINVDSIVDDFTNIPEEELEQIAFESLDNDRKSKAKIPEEEQIAIKSVGRHPKSKTEKLTRRQKTEKKSKKVSANSIKKTKKVKTPNISLLEQIISDERPLEEIISLDAYETSPIETRNKRKKDKKTVLPKIVRPKAQDNIVINKIEGRVKKNIYECYVKLIRKDYSRYLNKEKEDTQPEKTEVVVEECVPENPSDLIQPSDIDVPIVNDFHFQDDMLDVSEDIVIDSNCEFKLDVKELVASESVIEEVVLDNSKPCEEGVSETAEAQQETRCTMYDYSADEDLKQDSYSVTGNGDAVLAIECIENNFLAACLDGNVYHFNPDGHLLATLRGSNLAVTCLTIVNEKYGTTVYTGSLDSRIRYYDLETGLEKGPECNVLSPIQTMDRAWDTVFVGTRTGFVLQFECKNNMLIPVSTIKFSEQSILALRALKEGPRKVLLVAARSEDVTIKDAQTGLLLRTLVGPKMTVYTLLYEDGKIYCGTSSNQIQVFDYASGTHIGKHDGGKGAVCLRAAGGLLFAGCYDGCVYVFRSGEGTPFAQLRGPGVMLLSLAVVGSKIIAGYKDRSLYIWKIPINILQEMVL